MKARVADIVTIAADIWKIHPRDITGTSRFRFCMRPRQAVYLIAREQGLSFPQIARRMQRDHSTVISGIAAAGEIAKRDPEYATMVEALRSRAAECKPWGMAA